MFIVDQGRNVIWNTDKAVAAFAQGEAVTLNTGDKNRVLGRYETEERAKEVFGEMLKECFSMTVYDSDRNGVYYMPEA